MPHEQLIEIPGTARFASHSRDPLREPGAEFIAPAPNGFITHYDATLEQQFFNVAQAQLKPKVPANGTTDDHRWKAMSVVERFRIFISRILRDHLGNVTKPDMVYRPWSLEGRRIETVQLRDPVPPMSVGLAWRSSAELSPAMHAVREYFRHTFMDPRAFTGSS